LRRVLRLVHRSISRALTSFVLVALAAFPAGATVHLSETGSTLLYPIMTVWIRDFCQANAGVRIDAGATGSGVGISAAINGSVQIGASDAYLSDKQMEAGGVLNIPLAVSAQEVDYNVPELRGGPPLQLTAEVLGGMYDGTLEFWDDPKIAALNPGRDLPHHAILPVVRSDGSGDTFIFTQYLSLALPSWNSTIHFGTNVHWPHLRRRTLYGTGNAGMIDNASRAAYSIAYLGISYDARARAAGLSVAALQNRSGAFVAPTTGVIADTASARAEDTPENGRLSLIYSAGADAYPLVNFEYAIVKSEQPAAGVAEPLRAFLDWIVDAQSGNDPALLSTVHFAPLPERVRAIARREIASITGT
jgi:phosphate transport system substrate-binding protein